MATSTEIAFMDIALNLAFNRIGATSPNPAVGAVIVKNGKIIGSGATGNFGDAHAEIKALRSVTDDPRGADIYVTLEPCCHYGKTPPCTLALRDAGIRKVYFPIFDPNPVVAGKGLECLKNSGIEVEIISERNDAAYDLIRHFYKYIIKKSPFIIHKSAMTLDGYTAADSGDSNWISGNYSRCMVHRLRSIVDAVVIGKGCAGADNPALNVRLNDFSSEIHSELNEMTSDHRGYNNFLLARLFSKNKDEFTGDRSPLRVIVGLVSNLTSLDRFFYDDNFLIFASPKDYANYSGDRNQLDELVRLNNIILLNTDNYLEIANLVSEELFRRGKMLVLLEGGSRIAGAFYQNKAIDQYMYFIAPKILSSGYPVIKGVPTAKISEAAGLNDITSIQMPDGDILINGYSEVRLD